jgi:2-dehydro-3-deoxy-D-arabinonate dehydratase
VTDHRWPGTDTVERLVERVLAHYCAISAFRGLRLRIQQAFNGVIGAGRDAVRLVRFRVGRGEPRSGVLDDPGADAAKPAVITALAALALPDLLGLPLGRIREICQNPGGQTVPADRAVLLAPVSGRTEVWAAGVTYQRSRAARMAESEHSADIYDRVYAAERPELFFKSAAWRVCGPGVPVSVRADSSIDVPEPELAVVLNYAGEVAGYTICNDVSSRSIEGENPLYLPQAKIYLGGCAVGPWIRPAWEVPDPYALTIEMTITRGNAVAWQGTSSTSGLRRRIDELAAYLFREDDFPAGVVLSTGTSLVPDLPFTLQAGDEIRIKISEIGELVNPVVRGKAAVAAAVHADASDTLTKDRHSSYRQQSGGFARGPWVRDDRRVTWLDADVPDHRHISP